MDMGGDHEVRQGSSFIHPQMDMHPVVPKPMPGGDSQLKHLSDHQAYRIDLKGLEYGFGRPESAEGGLGGAYGIYQDLLSPLGQPVNLLRRLGYVG